MQITLTVIDAADGQPHDIVLTAEPASTLTDVASAIGTALHGSGADPGEKLARVVPLSRDRTPPKPVAARARIDRLWMGARALDPELTLRHSPLREGCTVIHGAAGLGDAARPIGVVELRVVGGPAAGGVHRLGLGERTVGLAPMGGVAIADQALADDHLRVVVAPTSVAVVPMPGRAVLHEGQQVPGQGIWWRPGELIEAGDTLLALALPSPPDAVVRVAAGGGLVVSRSPRHQTNPPHLLLEVPTNTGGDKRDKKADREYADAMARFTADLSMAARDDAVARRQECPDPAEVLLTALGPGRRLWERRRGDTDALLMRLGVRSLPAQIELTGPGATHVQPPTAWSVPIAVSLAESGVIGVAGSAGQRTALARWLLVQAATLNGPRDLSIVVLGGAGWEWVRWLPHLRPRHGQDAAVLVGNDAETAAKRLAELATRIAVGAEESTGQAPAIVLIDGPASLRELGGLQAVLAQGPAVGIFTICLEGEEHLLPEECRVIVGFDPANPARLRVASTGAEQRRDVLADQVSLAFAEQAARALAPLHEDTGADERAGPAGLRLLELLDLDPPTVGQIADGWSLVERSTTARIGVGPGGECALDLRRHGPHCLVTGAAGSGKSEFLQTVIAALAAVNRPDALSFVFVDGAGSGTFADCAELPHAVGALIEPDSHAALRAMDSLTAETHRRERLLADAGATDINGYVAIAAGTAASSPGLPRLVIVVDEFDALVQRLPEFTAGLLELATRGRALGVHLIVATEHPAHVIARGGDHDFNARVALRVTDEAQSSAAVGVPDSAGIPASTPGCGYAQLGTDAAVQFQVARVAGRPPDVGGSVAAHLLPWAMAGRPPPAPPQAADTDPDTDSDSDSDSSTDLTELVAAIFDAASQLGLATPERLWLPPLPEMVTPEDLPDEEQPGEGGGAQPSRVPPVPYALADLPAQRRRRTVYYDVEQGSHLVVVGAGRSGRSTLLRTIAIGIAGNASVDDVQLLVIDCGSDALKSLATLPHCLSVVTEEDTADLQNLLAALSDEVIRRHQLLRSEDVIQAGRHRAATPAGARWPYLVVVLDGWEDFVEEYETGADRGLITTVHGLLAEGAAVGLRFVLSCDHSGLVEELSTSPAERILLRLDDPADYALAGADRSRLPSVIAPGRGVLIREGIEIQVVSLTSAPTVPAEQPAEQATTPAKRPGPQVKLTRTAALTASDPQPSAVFVGVGGEPPVPRHLNLAVDGPGLLVAGPAGSGRSTTLATMLRSLLASGRQAVVLSPRPSPLRDFAGQEGVAAMFDGLAAAEDLQAVWAGTPSPKVLIVDDLELFGPGSQMDQVLFTLLSAAATGDGVVGAGTIRDLLAVETGFGLAIRQSRSGLLLTPELGPEGELFGLSSDAPSNVSSAGEPAVAGRGWLIRAGVPEQVQVPIGG